MSAPVLEVRDLAIDYWHPGGWLAAVDGVSFALERGEVLGLAGESGSGKSTVAAALLGERKAGARLRSGTIRLGGDEVLSLTPRRLRAIRGRRVAMVPQNPGSSLTPSMRVGSLLAEVLLTHRTVPDRAAARRRAVALLEEVGLPAPEAAIRRYPHQFSGGQQQRIALALALAAGPELLVLDEPTTGLDVTTQARILALLAEIRARSATAMLYVSHDLGSLAQLCDRLAVMQTGKLVEIGSLRQVVEAPRHDYTKRLIEAVPSLSTAPRGRRDAAAVPAPGAPGLTVSHLTATYAGRGWLFPRRNPPLTLNDVSFSLAPGRTFALVGESGSGKTTAARIIAGLLRARSGTLSFGAEDLDRLVGRRPPDLRRRIQLIYQNPDASLNRRHRVGTIIGRPLSVFFGMKAAARRARVLELLADVRLPASYIDRFPTQLSGGERQRVAIARALAAEPTLILCDEILSALDVSVQAGIIALLRELQQKRGVAYLFISHDLAVVRWLAHEVGVLRRGELCEVGPAERIFTSPAHPYTQMLLAAVPDLHAPKRVPEEMAAIR